MQGVLTQGYKIFVPKGCCRHKARSPSLPLCHEPYLFRFHAFWAHGSQMPFLPTVVSCIDLSTPLETVLRLPTYLLKLRGAGNRGPVLVSYAHTCFSPALSAVDCVASVHPEIFMW